MNIRKYDLKFKSILEVNSIKDISIASVSSIGIATDGSVWAAFKEAKDGDQEGNMLVKISLDGKVIKNIEYDKKPFCVCIDKSDNSVWVTGMTILKDFSRLGDEWPSTLSGFYETIETEVETFTHKYNSKGERILELEKGGYSIDIDPSDKSVWIGGHDSIIHYSSKGDLIKENKDVSKQKKWIVVVK